MLISCMGWTQSSHLKGSLLNNACDSIGTLDMTSLMQVRISSFDTSLIMIALWLTLSVFDNILMNWSAQLIWNAASRPRRRSDIRHISANDSDDPAVNLGLLSSLPVADRRQTATVVSDYDDDDDPPPLLVQHHRHIKFLIKQAGYPLVFCPPAIDTIILVIP